MEIIIQQDQNVLALLNSPPIKGIFVPCKNPSGNAHPKHAWFSNTVFNIHMMHVSYIQH